MNVFKQLKEFYWKDRWLISLSLITLMCATALGLAYPYLLRHLIDNVIIPEQFEQVPLLAGLVILFVSLKACAQYAHAFSGGRIANRFAYRIRNSLYRKLQYLSFAYYDKAKTGDLMSRLTGDLEAMRQFVGFGFAQIVNVFVMVSFGSIAMFTISWKLTLITLVTMPFLAWTALTFESKIHPAFRAIRKSMSTMTTAVQENITGVRTVKSFAREPYEVEKFDGSSQSYKTSHIETANIWAKYFPVMELLANASVVILLGAGGYMVIAKMITLGELVAFFSLIWYIIPPIWGIGFHINTYTQCKASGERILEILHQYVHVKDKDHAIELTSDRIRGHVQFENVSFSYQDGRKALHNFSVDAPPGSVIGLLGGTGSGKTTVIQLLLRAYNVKEGRILLDGLDIRDVTYRSLREHIAVVFQETFLFSSSIRNNIGYGRKDVTMDEIITAAKLAKAHDFIMELPEQYDTVVGERGLGLSGGQKQRIAIARAIIMNPKLLILDDATSAVDMETEHDIQEGLRAVMKGRTTFIIAHRISSLKHADEIIVLEDGKVLQRGTHRKLLAEPGHYLDTYRIQYDDLPDGHSGTEPQSEAKRRLAN